MKFAIPIGGIFQIKFESNGFQFAQTMQFHILHPVPCRPMKNSHRGVVDGRAGVKVLR